MFRVGLASAFVGASLSSGSAWVTGSIAMALLTVASWRVVFATERRIEDRIDASERRILAAIAGEDPAAVAAAAARGRRRRHQQ